MKIEFNNKDAVIWMADVCGDSAEACMVAAFAQAVGQFPGQDLRACYMPDFGAGPRGYVKAIGSCLIPMEQTPTQPSRLTFTIVNHNG